MTKRNTLAMVGASKLFAILAMGAMMLWMTGTANAAAVRDFDGEGLRNGQERNVTHTNPYKADTDGDHIKDGDEDTDHDGLDNTNELKLSLPMGDADADEDGVEDGDEDADHDGTDNEDEDDQQGSSDECAPGVEDDADEDTDDDDLDDEDEGDADTDDDGDEDGDEDDEDDDCDGVEDEDDEDDDDQGEDEQ